MVNKIKVTEVPELMSLIDNDKNTSDGIDVSNLHVYSSKTINWKCENGHTFKEKISVIYKRKHKCFFCTGRQVWPGENDLKTLYPEIAKEFDVEKNNGISPKDVSPFTYNSYWWICPKGHSYKKKVIQRTKFHKPIDCPKCIKAHSTSFPEQAIYYYAKKCFPDTINRYKEPFEKGMELDIYIPSYKLGIEYDGIAFHNDEDQHNRERRKYLACKQLGIKLIRIKESKDTWNDTADDIFYVSKRMKDSEISKFLMFFFSKAFSFQKYSFKSNDSREAFLTRRFGFPTDFDVSKDRSKILEYLIDVKNSFGIQYPELAIMWDEKENGELTPFMFTSGSNYQATWKCPKCGNTWKSPISSIVSRKVTSCKVCSMRENGNTITKVKTTKNGSLAEKSESLLKQWDFESNGSLSPYEIPLNYSFKVAWKCDKCGYKWFSSPNSRVRGNKISECPHCTGRVALQGVDDLETLYPDIASEWDYARNNGVLPSQIKPFSNKKYYWLCRNCGDSYAAYPGSRIRGSGCPTCAHIKVGQKNSKLVGQFDENGVLINTYQGLHQAAKAMQVVPNSIFQAVKSGGKSKGYYWKYIVDKHTKSTGF